MFAAARHCLTIFACGTIASSVWAQPAAAHRDQLVVSPAWLASHLHDPDLVLLRAVKDRVIDADDA